MRKDYLVFGQPKFEQAEIDEVVDTIRSGWVGTGPKSNEFEKKFAEYIGVPHCVAVSSCTAALHLSMLASGVGPDDEVIVPAMTFCATVNAVIHAGARPVFADISLPSMTLDPKDVLRKCTKKTKAIIPVHFHGRPADMKSLKSIAVKKNLLIIEDAAHAIETQIEGEPAGSIGDIAAFSFYVTKNLTTVEGGMVATKCKEWADIIRINALHGLTQDAWSRFSDSGYKHYTVTSAGFKYNMTDIQASFGLHQLKRIDENLKIRESVWDRYNNAFSDLPLILPADPNSGTRHARHLYAVRVKPEFPCDRDTFMHELHLRNIGTGVHYTSLSKHEFYQEKCGVKIGELAISEEVGDTTVSLPLSAGLSDEDVQDVIDAVREIAGKTRNV